MRPEQEPEHALLADTQGVEAAPVELEGHAAALVQDVVRSEPRRGAPGRATARRPRRPSPRRRWRPPAGPRRSAASRRARAPPRRPPRPRPGPSCPARRGRGSRRPRRRPPTDRSSTRTGRPGRCRRARAGTASARSARHEAGRPGSGGRAPRARSSHSKPASVSVSAKSSCAGCSLPGGLTVLMRSSRCSSSTASEPSAVAAAPSPSTRGRLVLSRQPRRSRLWGIGASSRPWVPKPP